MSCGSITIEKNRDNLKYYYTFFNEMYNATVKDCYNKFTQLCNPTQDSIDNFISEDWEYRSFYGFIRNYKIYIEPIDYENNSGVILSIDSMNQDSVFNTCVYDPTLEDVDLNEKIESDFIIEKVLNHIFLFKKDGKEYIFKNCLVNIEGKFFTYMEMKSFFNTITIGQLLNRL